jgi:hypothetical protein
MSLTSVPNRGEMCSQLLKRVAYFGRRVLPHSRVASEDDKDA